MRIAKQVVIILFFSNLVNNEAKPVIIDIIIVSPEATMSEISNANGLGTHRKRRSKQNFNSKCIALEK